jgi:hypothetical protein
MKRVLTLLVVLAVLGMCAPSYGYFLIYKLTSTMRVIDYTTDSSGNLPVKGYLVVDISDEDGDLLDANMVFYGKDDNGDKTYFVQEYDTDGFDMDWDVAGDYLGVDIWNDNEEPFDYELTLTGVLKNKNVGFGNGSADRRSAPNNLKGTMVSWWDTIFDIDQELFGSGEATMTFVIGLTKAANKAEGTTMDDILTGIVDDLQDKGYEELLMPI